jgi:streptomycin 6-kinase
MDDSPSSTASDERRRLDALVRAWNLVVERTVETGTSVLAFGNQKGRPVVLKIVKRNNEEWNCGRVLEAFGGTGVVRVYEQVEGAVLMERAAPGGSLVNMAVAGDDDQATAVIADVIRRTSGVRPRRGYPTLHDLAKGFERYAATADTSVPRDLLDDGRRRYERLAASQRDQRLLHGDLQHSNVLRDERRGWLAIDPKGVVGEIEYEVGAALRNPVEAPELFTSPRTIEHRLQQFASHLRLDVDRTREWAFAQAVLSAVWEVEDGFTVRPESPVLTLARRLRRMIGSEPR